MKTAQTIANDILSSNLTNDDIRVLQNALREAWDINTRKAKYAFRVKDRVQFTNSRTGRLVIGEVTKLAIKNVQVRSTEGVNWTVSPNLLSKAV